MIQAHPSGLLGLVKPLHAKRFGKKNGTRTGMFHPTPLVPSIWCGPNWTPPWVNVHRAQTRMLKRPSGGPGRMGLARNTATSPRNSSLPCIDRPLHVKEKHSKQERRNKSNKFITTWPQRSECDKSPPVVRRSAVEWPPPNRAWVTTTALDMDQVEGKHGVELVGEQRPCSRFLFRLFI